MFSTHPLIERGILVYIEALPGGALCTLPGAVALWDPGGFCPFPELGPNSYGYSLLLSLP